MNNDREQERARTLRALETVIAENQAITESLRGEATPKLVARAKANADRLVATLESLAWRCPVGAGGTGRPEKRGSELCEYHKAHPNEGYYCALCDDVGAL